jgi:hypothetical protein
MRGISGATLRRLIPALAVAGVLGFSALAPITSLGSSDPAGYGYRNNCGVKGSGYHDHGKVCPNRPFPGKGNGVSELADENNTSAETTDESTTTGGSTKTSHGNGNAATLSVSATSETDELTQTQSTSKGHHGKGHGHSKAGD